MSLNGKPWAAAVLVCLAAVGAAPGDVTIHGQVQYWDQIAGAFRPARHIFVEVEGDWWMSDPHVETDANGNYKATVRNPYWGDYDGVDIEAYAETEGRLQVYSATLSLYPYHIISKEVDNVKDNQTVRIDLRFGQPSSASGPGNLNVGSSYYRDEFDTAKAFIIHQQMYAHYEQLSQLGWPGSAFDEKEVIAPAMNPFAATSYYNHATNYINIVAANDKWGMGAWNIYPNSTSSGIPSLARFYYTCRHEYSHAIHDEITLVSPFGLNLPCEHFATKETNRWVAYTEGFADFLALVTFGRTHPTATHLWENSRATSTLSAFTFPSGDHWAMEGEVTGILWDIHDAKGFEVVRHFATKSSNSSHTAPQHIVEQQFFYDGLNDAKAQVIRKVAGDPYVFPSWSGSIETIRQFLDRYKSRYPNDLHALKAIAYNRGITDPMPTEHAAWLSGTAQLSRFANKVTLVCSIREQDAEDRPWVRMTAYHERPTGTGTRCAGLDRQLVGGPWYGDTRHVKATFTLPSGYQAGDPIWIEVNDDMEPRLYRFTVPTVDGSIVKAVIKDLGPKAFPGIVTKIDPTLIAELTAKLEPKHEKVGPGGIELRKWPQGFQPEETVREDFQGRIGPPRWQLVGDAKVVTARAGRYLSLNGFATGVWHVGDLDDFRLQFRYRHGSGSAGLLICPKGALPPRRFYHLVIEDAGMRFVREDGGVEKTLATAARRFQSGRWYTVLIQFTGGRLFVGLDNRPAMSAEDPKPIGCQILGFGSLTGTGVGYDDIVLVRRPRAEIAKAASLAALCREARKLLRSHAERDELSRRNRRLLYRLAVSRGRLTARSRAADLFRVRGAGRTRPATIDSPQQVTDRRAFAAWVQQRVAGTPLAVTLAVAERRAIADRARRVNAAVQAHRADAGRAGDLMARLESALAAYQKETRKGTRRRRGQAALIVEQLRGALAKIKTQRALPDTLDLQRRALEGLAR